jgi:hypothetical protein
MRDKQGRKKKKKKNNLDYNKLPLKNEQKKLFD